MPGLGSGCGNSCAEQGVNELFSETPAAPLGAGSGGFSPALLAVEGVNSGLWGFSQLRSSPLQPGCVSLHI